MINLGPFRGMNNRAADHALPQASNEDARSAVRNAVSVDFDNAGKATRRKGYTKKLAGVAMNYGFSCSQGVFVVEHGSLFKVNISDWTKTEIATGLTGDTFTECEFNGVLYFSDTTKAYRMKDGVASTWGLDAPPAPVVYTGPGIFGAGVYLCALTYVDAEGNESGASEIATIDAPENCSIVFHGLPNAHDAKVVATRLYLSTPNGDVLYQCGEAARGISSYSVLFDYDGGKEVQTLFLERPPAGQIIREFNGRMGVAKGKLLYFSDPYSLDLVNFGRNVIQFPADISVFEPVDDGIWIVSDKTYFYAGSGPDDFQQRTVLEYGATLGTGQKMPDTGHVTWFSKRGLIVAGNSGEIKNIQEDSVAPDYSDTGAMLIREFDGKRQAITSLVNPTLSPLAASSFVKMEVIRRS